MPVRETVEFLLQSGSLDNRFGGANRGLLGGQLHRKLQKEAAAGYEAEVFLTLSVDFEGTTYTLEGRADGVVPGEVPMIEEIKTTGTPLRLIHEDYEAAHWGQAAVYGHILAVRRALPKVGLRLCYYNVDTKERKYFYREKTAGELADFVDSLLLEYQKWALFRTDWQEERTGSAKVLAFPFSSYRQGQWELSAVAYRGIERGLRLFCQAPTGTGKTVSSLFPAIKAMGEGLCTRIFYLTAKTITRQGAQDALCLLREQGLRIKSVTLTAKDKICFLEERNCNPEACPYADGYYGRVRGALYTLIQEEDAFDREKIQAAAKRFRVCPFELGLDLSLWCDVVICDYNYLFDPVVKLQRFFGDRGGEYAFLVDEAHNLIDRARDMYSATLQQSNLAALKKNLGPGRDPVRKALRGLIAQFTQQKNACGAQGFFIEADPREAFVLAVQKFTTVAAVWLEENREPTRQRQGVLDLYFESAFFGKIFEVYNKNFCCLTTTAGRDSTVKLLCMDPAPFLADCLGKGRSALFFSATLSPLTYYRDLLGGGEDSPCLGLASPFAQENLGLFCAEDISTRYHDRQQTLPAIVRLLHAFISGKRGNYLVYFPSYQYLKEVYSVFRAQYPAVATVLQTPQMDEAAREAFLDAFQKESCLLGFCVLGGVFSEGVDLKGERLIGTAIVGVGLPQISPELNHLREYFDKTSGQGYAYIYRYPGMNKVLQAAGRVIRGEKDRGVVLLVDDRFPQKAYQALFPPHWSHWQPVKDQSVLEKALQSFWNE